MVTPTVHDWRSREIVTADTLNAYVRDVHGFLYRPPAAKLALRQRGTYSGANPADAVDRGRWLPFNTWATIPLYQAGKGTRPADEYDPSGMAKTGPDGTVWGLAVPESGLYAVTFGGVIDTNGEASNVHFRVGKGQWGTSAVPFASHCPGRYSTASDGTSRYLGSISTTIALSKGEVVSVMGIADKDFVLARSTLAGRSFLELRWVGRIP
ncbi:hypothetical protein ACH427_03155 [Streptomyces sp. NPDC020379]|uniref:hypothetical protein n=1 Tax=Streptomyces sp. NPDC020379 TaxID=3365071 RepID=UPI0037B48674